MPDVEVKTKSVLDDTIFSGLGPLAPKFERGTAPDQSAGPLQLPTAFDPKTGTIKVNPPRARDARGRFLPVPKPNPIIVETPPMWFRDP